MSLGASRRTPNGYHRYMAQPRRPAVFGSWGAFARALGQGLALSALGLACLLGASLVLLLAIQMLLRLLGVPT